jgi:hypothetical protein
MSNRMAYTKPQAMLFTDAYTSSSAGYIPSGTEFQDFIILSDHSRSEIDVKPERIENRKRMINGTMRSYHIADKNTYSTSWEMLPSRAYDQEPVFDANGIPTAGSLVVYTADGGAGGWDLVSWYESHPGPFWLLLSYDADVAYGQTNKYVKAVRVMFSDFNHSVQKRGITDLWNVSLAVEEV